MPELREFMRKCIAKNKTDFFLTFCTNGVKFTQEFLDLVGNFSNTNFSFSIDGYDRINDYWRSGSNWNKVIENAHLVESLGHAISINTVPGIYNVTNMHHLFEFLDQEFPMTSIYMQVNYLPWQSAYNHPLADLVIDSMRKCQRTSIYHSNGKSCKTSIDSILHHYSNNPHCDLEQLKKFFDSLPNKNASILIPGCGNAYEAEYLLNQGFSNVTLIDIAPTLVRNLKSKFRGNPSIQVLEGDFFQLNGNCRLG
jgi:sulfatase maturation enzyme AslB (radical SAM superfamily)